MCLSDLGTAVLIGGEGVNQQSCKDALWKLEIGGDFRAIKGNGGSGTQGQLMQMEGGTRGSVRREGTAKVSHLLAWSPGRADSVGCHEGLWGCM